MKKILFLILAAVMILTVAVLPAFARAEVNPIATGEGESVASAEPGELPEVFTWQYLATTAGAAVVAFAVVQFIKAPLDRVFHVPTRLLVYLICLATLLIANQFLNHGLTIEVAALSVFNALISAYTAYGLYEVWVRKKAL